MIFTTLLSWWNENINIFDILFLPLVFFIGLITSYDDFKYGKVRNKWIRLGTIWAGLVIFFFFIWYFVAEPVTRFFSSGLVHTVNLGYLVNVVINAITALIISFFMWRGKAWAAGDAKLFFIYALLLPLKYYWKSYLPIFPSFVLLINIFIPIFIYLFIRALVYFLQFSYLKIIKQEKNTVQKQKQEKKPIKERLKEKVKSMGAILLVFISIFLFFNLFQEPIKEHFSIDITSFQMFVVAGLIIFRNSVSKLIEKPIAIKAIIVILIVVLSYGFIVSPVTTGQFLKQIIQVMIIFIAIFTLFVSLIDFHIAKTGTKEIKAESLKPNMNLEEQLLDEIDKDKEYSKQVGKVYPDGLTKEQVPIIKKWLQKNRKGETIKIYNPFPFVIWMFIGVIITLILKSSLFHLFINTG